MAAEMKIDGNLVKHLREERAWSQEHLASVAGLSTRTVQRLEADGRASGESRMALAAVFGLDPAQLAVVGAVSASAQPASANAINPAGRVNIVICIVFLLLAVMMLQLILAHQLGKSSGERNGRAPAACVADSESESCRR